MPGPSIARIIVFKPPAPPCQSPALSSGRLSSRAGDGDGRDRCGGAVWGVFGGAVAAGFPAAALGWVEDRADTGWTAVAGSATGTRTTMRRPLRCSSGRPVATYITGAGRHSRRPRSPVLEVHAASREVTVSQLQAVGLVLPVARKASTAEADAKSVVRAATPASNTRPPAAFRGARVIQSPFCHGPVPRSFP